MAELKGKTWNQNQLKILFHLQQGKAPKEVAAELKVSISLTKQILALMKKGKIPGEVTEEMIQKAPPPVAFGEFIKKKIQTTGDSEQGKAKPKENQGEQAPAPKPGMKATTPLKSNIPVLFTTALQLVNESQPLPMTQDIHISYSLALRAGYKGELHQWLSLCCRDFWRGRGHNMYQEYDEALSEQPEVLNATPS